MQVTHERGAGVDVHKKTVEVCCLSRDAKGKPKRETRTYGTTTRELLSLCDWLSSQDMMHVAIGLYGGILEACLQLTRKQLRSYGRQLAPLQASARAQN